MADPIDWSKLRQRAIELFPLDRSSYSSRQMVGLMGVLFFLGCALAAVPKERSVGNHERSAPVYIPTFIVTNDGGPFVVRQVKVVRMPDDQLPEAAAEAKASGSAAGANGVDWSVWHVVPGVMIDASARSATPPEIMPKAEEPPKFPAVSPAD